MPRGKSSSRRMYPSSQPCTRSAFPRRTIASVAIGPRLDSQPLNSGPVKCSRWYASSSVPIALEVMSAPEGSCHAGKADHLSSAVGGHEVMQVQDDLMG